MHARLQAHRGARQRTLEPFSWAAQVKLAIVLSAVAAMVTSALSGRVDETYLIVGTIVVASLLGWSRVPAAAHPARVHVRHR